MTSAWLIDADYFTNPENGRAVIRLWCKDENGIFPHYDHDFEPYFYVIDNYMVSKDLLKKIIPPERDRRPRKVEELTLTVQGKKYLGYKVTVHHPSDVPHFKEYIRDEFACEGKVLEADIPFAHRYLIDNNLACMDGIVINDDSTVERDPREDYPDMDVLVFDCEMLTSVGMPDPDEDPIIVIGCRFNDEVKLISGDKESRVLKQFFDYIRQCDPDIIAGYNQDNFDWPYIYHRAELHNMSIPIGRNGENMSIRNIPKIPGRMNVDLYNIVARTMDEVKVKKLENVAEYLGAGADFATITAKDIYKRWSNYQRDDVLVYSRQDIHNTWGVATELLPMYYELSKILRIPVDDVSRTGKGKHIDWLLMSEAHARGEAIPNIAHAYSKSEGGFVMEPDRGLYENVACLDYASLYPAIMMNFNISPETVVDESYKGEVEVAPEVSHRFRQDRIGLFKEILEKLVARRKEVKKEMIEEEDPSRKKFLDVKQYNLKRLANSVAGDTMLVLKTPEDEIIIESIENFYRRVNDLSGWKCLSVDHDRAVFKPVYAVTRHRPRGAYLIRTGMGDVTATGDHSVMVMKGKSSNRIRNSKFEELASKSVQELDYNDIIAQVNNVELGDHHALLDVCNLLKGEGVFALYIPKSMNLNKHNWLENRIKIINAINAGNTDSYSIRNTTGLYQVTLLDAEKEGIIKFDGRSEARRTNTYKVDERGREYEDLYKSFKHYRESHDYYVLPLERIESPLPTEILSKSFVANERGFARNKIPALIEIDVHFASLLGWYVAEGHVDRQVNARGGVSTRCAISNYNEEVRSEVTTLFERVFNYIPKVCGKQVVCNTSAIALIFKLLCGENAYEKKVADFIFNCTKKTRNAFLDSYIRGDGDKDGKRVTTKSRLLKDGISLLLKERDGVLQNRYESECYRISRRSTTRTGKKILSGDLYGQPPLSIEKVTPPEYVYDLSVEDTENFVTAEGLVLHNSFYGYSGWNRARWYSKECIESITAWGRYFIKSSIEIARDMGFDVVYGDTDSLFITIEGADYNTINKAAEELASKLTEELPILIELEDIYKNILFIEKKRYAGMPYGGSMVVKGLELRRGDWSELTKRVQRQVLERILEKGDFDGAVEIAKKTVRGIKDRKLPLEDYLIYKSLTREIQNYKSVQAHVKAAEYAGSKGYKYVVGSKVPFVITLNSRKRIRDKAFPADLIESFDGDVITDIEGNRMRIDSNYYINKQLLPCILRIVERFGYTEGDLSGVKQMELGI